MIGGIIGTEIVRYDIYGPDVLIANKMESSGVEGNINVSEDTKNLLQKTRPNLFTFTPHTTVMPKSTNKTIQTYLLQMNRQEENLKN